MESTPSPLDSCLNIEKYLNLGDNQHQHSNLYHSIRELEEHSKSMIGSYQQYDESQILLSNKNGKYPNQDCAMASATSCTSRKILGQKATARYREKKKMYQQELEMNVKELEREIGVVDAKIRKTKDQLLTKLEVSAKAVHSNENAQIFTELQACLPKAGEDEALADIDKINLLLNTLKYRIGPSGRQRQAKIQYNFKNIINTLFPGLHRYFLTTANHQRDIFNPNSASQQPFTPQSAWTTELYTRMNLAPDQLTQIKQNFEQKLTNLYLNTLQRINYIHQIKKRMKEEALKIDNAEDQIRENMTAVQCGKWTNFCEKHKYRKEISLDQKFKIKGKGKCKDGQDGTRKIEEQMEELLQYTLGRKRVHRDLSTNCV